MGSINDVIHRYTATAKGEPFMTQEEIFYGEARPASDQPRMRAFAANVSSPAQDTLDDEASAPWREPVWRKTSSGGRAG